MTVSPQRLGTPEFTQDPVTRECFQYGEPLDDLNAANVVRST